LIVRTIVIAIYKYEEWLKIEKGNPVIIQGAGFENAVEGTVLSVSQAPAIDNEWLHAYQALDVTQVTNPLSHYEVRILTDGAVESIPYGSNLNAVIIVNEALDAISVKEKWLHDLYKESASVWMINKDGRAEKRDVKTPFAWETRAVVTEGLTLGDIVLHEPSLKQYVYEPKVFLPIPSDLPSKKEWRAFGWRNYVKYILIR